MDDTILTLKALQAICKTLCDMSEAKTNHGLHKNIIEMAYNYNAKTLSVLHQEIEEHLKNKGY